MQHRRTGLALLAATVVAALAGACGDDEDGARGDAPRPVVSAEARRAIDAAVKGSMARPPAAAPRPEPGKNIWFIPLSAAAYDYAGPGSIHEAAKAIGWRLTQVDGKYSPDAVVTGIRQAIADKADGIVLHVVDCPYVASALKDARRAGVKVVAAASFDCDEVKPDAPALYDATMHYADPAKPDAPLSYPRFIRDVWGAAQALAVIDGTKGKADIIDLYEPDLQAVVEQDKGSRTAWRRHCPGCKVVDTVTFTGADVGTGLQEKIEQALARHPEANAMISPYDAVTRVAMAAVRGASRARDVFLVGGEGDPFVIKALRDGDGAVDAAVGLSYDWELYGMLDALNRLFHGEREPVGGFPTGAGTRIVLARDGAALRGGRYEPPIDFRAAYRAAWGL